MATQLKEPALEVEPTVVEATTIEPVANDGERDWEAEARNMGWKPEAEFKEGESRPREFKDAEAFVKDGEERGDLAKHMVKQLQTQLDKMKRDVRRLTKAEQDAYQRGADDLKAQMRAAVESGDVAAFDEASERLDKLANGKDAPAEDANEQFLAFRKDNSWFDTGALAGASIDERNARARAVQLFDYYAGQGLDRTMLPSEFFAKVADEVASEFPTLGKTPSTPRPRPVSDVAGVTRPGGAKQNGATALPAEARAQADRFFEMGVIKAKSLTEAREKYARDYFSQ